jgi:hypothetical protein
MKGSKLGSVTIDVKGNKGDLGCGGDEGNGLIDDLPNIG